MRDLKPKPSSIVIGGREFLFIFDLNTLDAIEEEYGTLDKMAKALDTAKGLKKVLAIVINQYIGYENEDGDAVPPVTEEWIGRNLAFRDRTMAAKAIAEAFSQSLPESEEDPANPPIAES